jgi:hypothetical protein
MVTAPVTPQAHLSGSLNKYPSHRRVLPLPLLTLCMDGRADPTSPPQLARKLEKQRGE